MSNPEFTHVVIREYVKQPHPQLVESERVPQTCREVVSYCANEAIAVENAEDCAKNNPGNKYLVFALVSVSVCEPRTTTKRVEKPAEPAQGLWAEALRNLPKKHAKGCPGGGYNPSTHDQWMCLAGCPMANR